MNEQRNKRILIVNPFGIGDVLFTTPIIESVKSYDKGAFIGYICNIRTAPILLANPNIDKVFIYEKDEYRSLWQISKIKCIVKLFSLLKEIKNEKFDTVFDLSLAQEYGLFLWLAGIKERVGYDFKNRGIFLTRKLKLSGGYSDKHMVEYYLKLLDLSGIKAVENPTLNIYIPAQNGRKAGDLLFYKGIKEEDEFICIAPGGGASWGETSFRKQWNKEGFSRLSKFICDETGYRVVLLGGEDDKPICGFIKENEGRCINLCAECDLMTFAAIIKRAKFLVTNDGGPLHVAVACATKTVSIFGPVDDRIYGPYPKTESHIVVKKEDMDCSPCYKGFKIKECSHRSCLEDISAEEAISAVKRILCR